MRRYARNGSKCRFVGTSKDLVVQLSETNNETHNKKEHQLRAAIVGAGSLGTIIGALINHAGKQIDLVDAYRDHVDALNTSGATITGAIDLNVPVKAYTPDQLTGTYDLVFLLTKQTSNQETLAHLLPYLHPDSSVCTLQNGIPEHSVAALVGRERTLGGAVGFGATCCGPAFLP